MQAHNAFKDSFWEIEQNWETLSKLFDPTTIKGFLLPPYCFSNKWEFLHWKNFTFTWSTKWKIKLSTTHKGRPFYPALLWVLFSVVGFSSVIWIHSWYFTNTHIFSLPLVTNERRTHALRYTFWCSHTLTWKNIKHFSDTIKIWRNSRTLKYIEMNTVGTFCLGKYSIVFLM